MQRQRTCYQRRTIPGTISCTRSAHNIMAKIYNPIGGKTKADASVEVYYTTHNWQFQLCAQRSGRFPGTARLRERESYRVIQSARAYSKYNKSKLHTFGKLRLMVVSSILYPYRYVQYVQVQNRKGRARKGYKRDGMCIEGRKHLRKLRYLRYPTSNYCAR